MKHFCFLLACILFAACSNSTGDKPAITKTNDSISNYNSLLNDWANSTLKNDSGYILKPVAKHLFSISLFTDTGNVNTTWHLLKDTDTIGKYYRSPKSGNYVFCILDYGTTSYEPHDLFEISHNGSNWKMIASEKYYHGNYPCCWGNHFEGFKKDGNMFTIKICGTGTGHCASNLYVFEKVAPEDSLNYITDYSLSESGVKLTSTMKINDSVIEATYFIDPGSYETEVKKGTIAVTYVLKGRYWEAKDSSLIKSYGLSGI